MIELTVKTLDSQNHQFSVEDDITVEQFKTKIAETVNIPAETQRIIYCGRVLQDSSKLADYDVNGKVVHLVQRPPPGTNPRPSSRSASPQPQRRGFRGFRGLEQGNAMYLGSMAFPGNLMESQGIVPPPPTHSLSGSRLNVAKRMLRRAEAVIQLLENPSARSQEQAAPDENPEEEEVTPVIEARVIVPNNNEPIDDVLNAVQNTLMSAATNAVPLSTATVDVGSSSTQSNNGSAQRSPNQSENSTPGGVTPRSSSTENLNTEARSENGLPENASRTSEMATLLTMLGQLQTRFAPFLERYQDFMSEDPEIPSENLQRQTQTMLNQVSEVLHFLGHAYHSLSDIIIRVRTPPPRPLLCRPILIQHSAVVQTGIPIQVEAQINLSADRAPPSNPAQSTNATTDGNTPTTTTTTSTSTPNSNPTNGGPTISVQPGFVGLPFLPGAAMRVQSFPVEIRAMRSATAAPRQNNNNNTVNTESGPTSATSSTNNTATPTGNAGNTGNTSSSSNNAQGAAFNFNNPNVEFFMEVTPEVLRGALNGPPPEFLQSLMQMAGQIINRNIPNTTTPTATTGSANTGGAESTQSSQQSSASQAATPPSAGQNSQARGNTQTHPTTATYTRSTARPHVHLAQQAMQGGFDPFLPCNSHHISRRRRHAQMAATGAASSSTSQQSTTQNNAAGGQRNATQNTNIMSFIDGIFDSVRSQYIVEDASAQNTGSNSNTSSTSGGSTSNAVPNLGPFAKQFSSGMPVDFKEIMDINGSVFKPVVRINFENDCCGGNSIDWITKLILLKATLGEISINSESLCILNRKRTHSEMELPKLSQELTTGGPLKFFDQKLQYMGDNPFTVFKEKDGEVTVEIVVSTTPSEYRIEKEYPETKCQTKRVATRLQIILDVIHENKIMEHAYRMEKIIIEEEMKTGYSKKLDRKSLARLLKKLVEEGYLKIYKVTISDSKILKTVLFMCHPTISYNDDLIQSSIQQLKWKHFVGCAKKTTQTNVPIVQTKLEEIKNKKQSPFSEVDVMNSIKDLKNIEKLKMTDMKNKYNKQAAKKYGIKPKFVRMRILHEFLFYLIYEYNEPIQPLKNDELDELFQKYRIKLSQEDLEGLPIVYCKEYSWKMFIPPLPQHKGWENGWALMCDVILRLPISVLCKVHACPYELPELLETLHHPIKRFFLVKDLPESIRNVVLHNRKYLFNIHESICRLAYCGLIQYGPKKYKEKDQIFVYLNRRASILNTTSSSPAYNKIENKEYPQLAFYFNCHSDLDDYWYNMNAICTSTKLNARNPGELVTIVDASANPELMKALNSKTPEEAIQDDNGEIPGDRQGASGLDSSLFSHLTRNWFWPIKQFSTKKIKGLKSERMNKVLPQVKPFKDLGTTNKSTKVYLHKGQTLKNRKRKPQIPSRSSKKSKKLTRKINARPRKAVREYYDSIDKAIVKKIGINRRMRWSSREDELLMLCKVGELYLYRDKYKKQVVAYHVLRDVIHRVCPESANKTSRSIQRRLKKLMKHTFTQLDEQVYNLDKIPYISDNFLPLVNKISKGTNDNGDRFRLSDVQVNTAFVVLMSIIIQHEDEVKDVLQGNLISNDHLSKLNLEYTERESIEIDKPSSKFEDAKNEDDIKKDVLKCIIHSSLANKDQSNVALQLLKVYQKYPDQLIRDAVEDLKQSNTISCKRFNMKKKKIWQVPFHLSQFYVFFQFTTFNVTTAVEAYKTFLDLRNQTDSLRFSEEAINTKRYGQLLGMNEFCSFWKKLRFEFDLPQNVIILNPSIKDHGELIHELAVRFQLKLERLQKENKESEREQDGEPESLRSKCSSELEITANEESPSSDTQNTSPSPMDTDDNPLDLTVDSGNSETISRLKTWVTDCLDADRERSPSPEFMDLDRNVENNDLIDETVPVETNSIEKMDENSDDVQEISATNNKVIERIPTLEEIKEEMLRISTNDDRRIPYITDLSDLLNKESFNELTTDEKTLKRLKTHFVAQYAALQKIIVEDFEHLENHNMINLIADEMKNKKIWDKVERDIVIDKMQPVEEVAEQIKKVGGTFQDVDLMREMIEFIETKGCIGATGQQLKEKFSSSQKILPLAVLVKLLVDAGIILQAGICTITFVHYKYHSLWLAETYQLTPEEQKVLLEVKEAAAHENECSIQKELRQKKMITVKVMPWNKIDGSLNKKLFRTWMCNILSHCLDYPKISFSKLCDKFCYLKPVDIYYSLEVLQELGCIEMFVYEKRRETLFSKWEKNVERRATFLDDFEYLTIEPNNVSMTCLGSFLYDHHQEMPI